METRALRSLGSEGLPRPRRTRVHPDRLDIEPHDPELLDEIQMLANLMLACSSSATRVSADAVDAALGL